MVSVAGTGGDMIGVGGESGNNRAGTEDMWCGLVSTWDPLLIPEMMSEVDTPAKTSSTDELQIQ